MAQDGSENLTFTNDDTFKKVIDGTDRSIKELETRQKLNLHFYAIINSKILEKVNTQT